MNPNHLAISPESFDLLASRYSEAQSYALLDMIQTVSVNRVFPPRAKDGKFHHHYHKYRLCAADKAAVKDALARHYNAELLTEKSNLETRYNALSTEKNRLRDTNENLKTDIEEATATLQKLESFILEVGDAFGLGDTVEDIQKEFHAQLDTSN